MKERRGEWRSGGTALRIRNFGVPHSDARELAAVLYIWLPVGYSIDQKKTVLVEIVGLPWIGQWAAVIAADVTHLALGSGQRVLVFTSLAGGLAGFGLLYNCLRRLHPLLVRLARAEGTLRSAGNATLLRTGTSWVTAFALFRLPTSISAGLCAARATADFSAGVMAVYGTGFNAAINPSLGLLLVDMVLAVAMINQLNDVGFGATMLLWLVGLIAATHTLLIVKGFCIALAMALAMRAAFKFVPEEDDEVAAAEALLDKKKKADKWA
ncbi:hypothetical protein VOLCADRAFT_117480 [Volvox carteri f. nagariensis]|uniref:Uncharacterized protein n=1 Tax=Volvox carteri f. nagariensis TaxID=3068 RepID=D8TUP5_VOLCA|nr:uncharacterized protein VOLCADRAFT_117480 [Volvox carteri f. nagariensis]EFJ48744.1 hypothetical protein VOLCADRAFT_117480 [Volvox carteri f. nagariensis]|eukprot:XP_002950076.1 hypothetical protein VOLCADRAFT_117480 [Volvox carteri f. nagariensis]